MLSRVLLPVLAGLAVLPMTAHASEEGGEDNGKIWSGTLEVGAVFTTGNTEEENLKFRTDWLRDTEHWAHAFHMDGLRSSQEGELTAHRLYAYYQADRKLNDIESIFARVSYEDDRFSGFDYQWDATSGYSRILIDDETMKLDTDVGAGFRVSSLDDGDKEEELIVRLAGTFTWQVSENSRFGQKLSTEIGEESTISRSETSLSANISGSLAMKLTYTVKHNSDPPVDTEATDTEASVTLVYEIQ
ncbi:MAG: DUF481 domain-containing protein [Pseudomonadales bacterium]|nr:DUF481 domain-containing protein [Pseudomonadales bacterium]